MSLDFMSQKSPAQKALGAEYLKARRAENAAARAGDPAAEAAQTRLAEALWQKIEAAAVPARNVGAESAAAIFARRREQASVARQDVHDRPGPAGRSAGLAELIDTASVYALRRQAAERTRPAGAGAQPEGI
jgi:hypothetical protein